MRALYLAQLPDYLFELVGVSMINMQARSVG
jgi:hypothetical protein